jgi:hypothetical protein
MAKLTQEQKDEKQRLDSIKNQEQNKQSQIRDLVRNKNNGLINNPTRHFEVDARVTYGAFQHSIVKEVLEGGFIYVLESQQLTKSNQYDRGESIGKPQVKIVAWYDIFPYRSTEEINAIPVLSSKFNFGQSYNSTISALIHDHYNFGIDMNPEYQRDLVWELEDKVALIDSIMNDVEIGRFVFMKKNYSSTESTMSEVIDGKQRLTALIEFFEDRFAYKGLKYSEMNPMDKNHFTNKSILRIDVDQMTIEQRMDYFIRINTTGKAMDAEHLENVKKKLKNISK